MNKILNVVTDQKFIDGVIERHDALDTFTEHSYILVQKDKQESQKHFNFKYIKKTERIMVVSSEEFLNHLKSNNYSGILLHNLYVLPLDLIPKIPSNIKVFWQIWGYDIYDPHPPRCNPFVKVKLYHTLTETYLKNSKSYSIRIKEFLRRVLGVNKINTLNYKRAVQRIDYISVILPFEFNLIKQNNPQFKASLFDYSYSNMSDFKEKIKDVSPNINTSILIGNSADPTNNHLDVFSILKKLNINREIIVPLSYSGTDNYVKKIIQEGVAIWGNRFKGQTSFVPREEYKKIIESCGYCIFFHERQQAIGNIELMLRLGSKVFLSETNPTFHYYKSLGIHIYSVQKDLDTESLSTPLTSEQASHNVTILNNSVTIETETEKLRVLSMLCSK